MLFYSKSFKFTCIFLVPFTKSLTLLAFMCCISIFSLSSLPSYPILDFSLSSCLKNNLSCLFYSYIAFSALLFNFRYSLCCFYLCSTSIIFAFLYFSVADKCKTSLLLLFLSGVVTKEWEVLNLSFIICV